MMGAHTSEYTLEYIIQALEANVMLVRGGKLLQELAYLGYCLLLSFVL
jgi:hypothetical protein